ncbi:hypothetical protein Plhal304r1_c003g0011091 [Plasmopara halstedii]
MEAIDVLISLHEEFCTCLFRICISIILKLECLVQTLPMLPGEFFKY